MKYVLCILLFHSCSFVKEKKVARSQMAHLYGPLPKRIEEKKVQADLQRFTTVEKIGKVTAQLISPAWLFLNARKKFRNFDLNRKEAIHQVDSEIDHAVRYETCFSLSVHSPYPHAVELNQWKAHIAYGQDFILPAKIYDMTEELKGNAIYSPESTNNYQAHAIICSLDRLDLNTTFTLVLRPQFRPNLSSIRFTWLEAKRPISAQERVQQNPVYQREAHIKEKKQGSK